jgi:hydrogenase maturation protease
VETRDGGSIPVRVVGLGSVFRGDDALGPWVIAKLLAEWTFPAGVSVSDAGTPGLDLTPFLSGGRHVILVDTVKTEGRPGDVRRYSKAGVLERLPPPRLSQLGPGVAETLALLDLEGAGPESLLLIGVVPGPVGHEARLSDEVRAADPRAADLVVAELVALGYPPSRRVPPVKAEPWWEQEPGPGG